MAFTKSWVETDPDGAIITVSQLDNAIRDKAVAVRERLEGDAAVSTSGVIETGTFAGTSIPKLGAARFYCDADANKGGKALQDGRGFFSSDAGGNHPKVYSMQASGLREIAYLNIDGNRQMTGPLDLAITYSATVASASSLTVRAGTAAAVITVTELPMLLVKAALKGAGSSIANLYGLFIENQTVGTNNFAIFTGQGKVVFDSLTTTNQGFLLDTNHNVILGKTDLAVGDNNGHVQIQKVAGPPTGVPAAYTGHCALVYDSTNNQIYINNGGVWKKTVALT